MILLRNRRASCSRGAARTRRGDARSFRSPVASDPGSPWRARFPATCGAPPRRRGPRPQPTFGISAALTLTAIAWSLVKGEFLWLPSALVARGTERGRGQRADRALDPDGGTVVLLSTWLYSTWSTKGSLMVMLAITTCGLAGVQLRSYTSSLFGNTAFDVTLLIIGSGAG